jgi:molybdenum cofactor synthesis domain-containing protein
MRPELFSDLVSVHEARRLVMAAAVPIARTETVELPSADGRVAARDLRSPIDVPPFDRAAMDGYAVRAADVAEAGAGGPASLQLVGEVYTGEIADRPIAAGECMAIATGAPMPAGADTVVMVEHTTRADGEDRVQVLAAAKPGQHVSRRGTDIATGAPVVLAGDLLGPARLGSVAAVGFAAVEVFAQPSVAVLSTGDEVSPPGRPLPAGHVYDVNRFTMEAVIRRHGGVVTPMAPAGDDLAVLTAALDAASRHDAIVFSGGSSVGERDLMLDALRARGTIVFHGIAVKPGKPTLFGHVGRTPVFGMPGNPASCLSNAYLLLVPFLRAVARLPPWRPTVVTAPLARPVKSTAGRHQFYTVRLQNGRVEPAFKSSGDITSMAQADGYIEIPADIDGVEAGALVNVTLF